MSADLTAAINIIAFDAASNVIRNVGQAFGNLLSDLPGPAKFAVGALALVGGAAVGIGVAAVQAASQYQQAMNMVQALTGSSQSQMSQYDTQLKALAINAGVAPAALASGLYNVLSAGYKGAEAMNVLTLATEDAKIGMTNSTVTTDALTNILNSFGVKAGDVTRVNGEMLQTVTLGKATFEQYATTIVKAAGSANQFHVSMETMNAAWATMTSSGIRAAQASTDFQQSLKVMYGNIGTVTTSLHKNGIAFDEAKFNSMSYGDKVVYLNQALQQANEKHVKITGVTIQAAQAIQTISQHIGTYNSDLSSLSDKTAMAQKTQQAWAITQNGFAQTMSRLQAALQVVLINIGQQLLPVLTKAAQQLLPLIQRFAEWIQQSGIITKIGQMLSVVLQGVIGFVMWLANAIATVVGFFQQNQWAVDLLVAALAGLGIGLAVFLATFIPALIAGFIAWAVAAGAAALATLAAAAPFILIGLVVAAVVFGIILAVQHWGQITTWLRGIWDGFSKWFGNVMSAIGSFFHSIWSGISSFFESVWTHIIDFLRSAWDTIVSVVKIAAMVLLAVIIGPIGLLVLYIVTHWTQVKQFLANVWADIISIVKTALALLVSIFTTPFRAIGALFTWLYNHNYYFQALVDKIRGIVSAVVAWLTGIWTHIVTWIVDQWLLLKIRAEIYWMYLYVTIEQKIRQVENFLHGIWTAIVTWIVDQWTLLKLRAEIYWMYLYVTIEQKITQIKDFVYGILLAIGNFFLDKWNDLVNFTTQLWQQISGIFGNAWNTYIAGPLGSLWNSIWGAISSWGSQALNAGQNLISMLAQGILNGAGAIWNAVTNIAGTIWKALGFHSPAEAGPGADADKWMPNLIKMLSAGLVSGVPQMQAAANQAAMPLTALSAPGAVSSSSTSNHSVSVGDIHVHLGGGSSDAQSQGRAVANVVKQELAKALRQQGITPRLTTGGH